MFKHLGQIFWDMWLHLILHILVAELQLHDVLEGPEERLVEVEVRELRPARQHLGQDVVDEGNGLLGHVSLFVTRCLEAPEQFTVSAVGFSISVSHQENIIVIYLLIA